MLRTVGGGSSVNGGGIARAFGGRNRSQQAPPQPSNTTDASMPATAAVAPQGSGVLPAPSSLSKGMLPMPTTAPTYASRSRGPGGAPYVIPSWRAAQTAPSAGGADETTAQAPPAVRSHRGVFGYGSRGGGAGQTSNAPLGASDTTASAAALGSEGPSSSSSGGGYRGAVTLPKRSDARVWTRSSNEDS